MKNFSEDIVTVEESLELDRFGHDLMMISQIYEEVRLALQKDDHVSAIELLVGHSELFCKHWQVVLCMTALSHDMLSTAVVLEYIIRDLQASLSEELLRFLVNLDRLLEIDGMQQLSGIIIACVDHRFMLELARLKATRMVLNIGIEDKLAVKPVYKRNTPSYLTFGS